MSSLDKELEDQLVDAGNKLLDPPSDAGELLPLLDKAESYLSRLEQSPIASIQSALSPYLKALVADKLFRHSDTDVKVAVASCISEITRITAPDAPFDDEYMKGAFQLIVSSFEHLDDESSRSYEKRMLILETLAKVRSCVVMLDLECDALILEMFQHFLKGVRDHHTEHVFSNMETIMTLVIEESEDISPELLSPILASVKKDNEGVLPVAKKLAEKILESSASKLKPYLGQVLESLGTKADDYSKVVGLVYYGDNGETKQNDAHEEAAHEVDKVAAPESVMSNGSRPVEEGSMVDSDSLKKQDNAPRISRLKITGLSSINKRDKASDDNDSKTVGKSSKSSKKRGKKRSTMASEPVAPTDGPEKPVDNQRDCPSSPHKDKSPEAELPAESKEAELPAESREADANPSSPKETCNESVDVASPSKTDHPDEIQRKKAGRPKKKQRSLKASENANVSEAKANVQIGKKIGGGASNEDRTPLKVKLSKKGADAISDADNQSSELSSKEIDATTVVEDDTKVKPQKRSSKKVDASAVAEDGTSLKSVKDKTGRTKGKVGHKKESLKNEDDQKISSSKSHKEAQIEGQSDETPKTGSKRKRTPEKEADDEKVYGEELVGKKIKVWWPKDRAFYDGVVDSFDSKKMKHKVKYDDGDAEVLNLRKQRWELTQSQGGSEPNEEQEVAPGSPKSDNDSIETEIPLTKLLKKMKSRKSGKISAKKSGDSASAKSKATSATPDPKSQDTNATDANMEKDSSGKSKDQSPNIGSKIVGLALRMTKKTKGMPEETSAKSKKAKSKEIKEETAVKGKGKTPKKGRKMGKVKSNGSDNVKSSTSDSERTESVDGSEEVPKKRKMAESLGTPGSGSKKGKKRQRGP